MSEDASTGPMELPQYLTSTATTLHASEERVSRARHPTRSGSWEMLDGAKVALNFFQNSDTLQNTPGAIENVMSSDAVRSLEDRLHDFEYGIPVVMNALNELAKIHPFIQAAVIAFVAVYKLESARRDNDNRVKLLYVEMNNMMRALLRLRDMKDVDDLDKEHLEGMSKVTAKDIKDCANACETYSRKKTVVKFVKSPIWERRFAEFFGIFTKRRKDFEFALTVHVSVVGDQTLSKVNEVEIVQQEILQAVKEMMALFEKTMSPQQAKLKDQVMKKLAADGPKEKDKGIKELLEKNPSLLDADGRKSKDAEKSIVNEAVKELKDSANDTRTDEQRNRDYFDRKFQLQQDQIVSAIGGMVHREGDRIIEVVNSGPHDKILDPNMYEIWKEMRWGGHVKASHFILALRDFYQDKAEIRKLQMRKGIITDPDPDEWAFQYIDLPYLQQIIEAIDDDASGFVTIPELNKFTSARPKDWSLPHWIAYWAVGWYKTMDNEKRRIENIFNKMYGLLPRLKPENLPLAEEYLTLVWRKVSEFVYSLNTVEMPEYLEYRFRSHEESEEKRYRRALKKIKYNINDLDALSLVTGLGRIEKHFFPLARIILKHHLDIFRLCKKTIINQAELRDASEAFRCMSEEVGLRYKALKTLFTSQRRDLKLHFASFAFGLFDYCDDPPKMWGKRIKEMSFADDSDFNYNSNAESDDEDSDGNETDNETHANESVADAASVSGSVAASRKKQSKREALLKHPENTIDYPPFSKAEDCSGFDNDEFFHQENPIFGVWNALFYDGPGNDEFTSGNSLEIKISSNPSEDGPQHFSLFGALSFGTDALGNGTCIIPSVKSDEPAGGFEDLDPSQIELPRSPTNSETSFDVEAASPELIHPTDQPAPDEHVIQLGNEDRIEHEGNKDSTEHVTREDRTGVPEQSESVVVEKQAVEGCRICEAGEEVTHSELAETAEPIKIASLEETTKFRDVRFVYWKAGESDRFYFTGNLDLESQSIFGTWGFDDDYTGNEGSFLFKRTPSRILRFRPSPSILQNSSTSVKARVLWKFAISAVLDTIQRRRWSWNYFLARRKHRQKYIDLVVRDEGFGRKLSDEESKEFVECRQMMTYRDACFYHHLKERKKMTLTCKTEYKCDNCGDVIQILDDGCITCIDCEAKVGLTQSIDFCTKPECVNAKVDTEGEIMVKPHAASHDVIFTRRQVHLRNIPRVFKDAKSAITRGRNKLRSASTKVAEAEIPKQRQHQAVEDKDDVRMKGVGELADHIEILDPQMDPPVPIGDRKIAGDTPDAGKEADSEATVLTAGYESGNTPVCVDTDLASRFGAGAQLKDELRLDCDKDKTLSQQITPHAEDGSGSSTRAKDTSSTAEDVVQAKDGLGDELIDPQLKNGVPATPLVDTDYIEMSGYAGSGVDTESKLDALTEGQHTGAKNASRNRTTVANPAGEAVRLESASPEPSSYEILCAVCNKAARLPCWYCIDCSWNDVFICFDCNLTGVVPKGSHEPHHTLVRCQDDDDSSTKKEKSMEENMSALHDKIQDLEQHIQDMMNLQKDAEQQFRQKQELAEERIQVTNEKLSNLEVLMRAILLKFGGDDDSR